ncbi:sugar transporter ERD6-like 5 [Quercus suber]|uniref:sugar transporter ERD6-like 5 n=1 Tax=Quercus suber TaxID=58331 RepID=UPI0032DF0F16
MARPNQPEQRVVPTVCSSLGGGSLLVHPLLQAWSYRQSGSSSVIGVVVLSTLVAVSGSYVFGTVVGYSSPAQSGIVDDLGLTVAEYSLFGSILTIGAMIGAIVSGQIVDYIGGRGTMGFLEILCLAGWLAIAFSKGACWLDLGRLLVGCGMGLLSYVVGTYNIAEITPKNLRGGLQRSLGNKSRV